MFFTKLAGVSKRNSDRTARQAIIGRCRVGEELDLVREPDNRYDSGAVKVLRKNGEQLGYLPAHVVRRGDSSGLASRIDRGDIYRCRISALTGGGELTRGVNVEIAEAGESFGSPTPHRPNPPALATRPWSGCCSS